MQHLKSFNTCMYTYVCARAHTHAGAFPRNSTRQVQLVAWNASSQEEMPHTWLCLLAHFRSYVCVYTYIIWTCCCSRSVHHTCVCVCVCVCSCVCVCVCVPRLCFFVYHMIHIHTNNRRPTSDIFFCRGSRNICMWSWLGLNMHRLSSHAQTMSYIGFRV